MRYELLVHWDNDGVDDDARVRHSVERPWQDAAFLRAEQHCPRCNVWPLDLMRFGEPEEVKGVTYAAVGCRDCKRHVGTVSATPSTLFGEDEDRAVLHGRPRVY